MSQLVMIKVADLVPWDKNPRFNDHAVERVAESIREFGFAAPVVARAGSNVLICGHTRLKAAQQIGLDKIPCHLIECDERTAERLAIADNKLGGIATFDEVKLADLLSNFDDTDLDALGFDDTEISDLLQLEAAEETVEEYVEPETVESDVDFTLLKGDCLTTLKTLPDNSVDAIFTDPPYHLTSIVERFGGDSAAPAQFGDDGAFARASRGFMGQQWDGGDIAFNVELWKELNRVLKPGGFILAFSSTRTIFKMGVAMMDAGLTIRDTVHWLYKNGFPKGLDLSVAIDKHFGVYDQREVVGSKHAGIGTGKTYGKIVGSPKPKTNLVDITAPVSEEAKRAVGLNIALKPAVEPAILARKPIEGTNAENYLKYGTGALNIDACRYPYNDPDSGWIGTTSDKVSIGSNSAGDVFKGWEGGKDSAHELGRYPANVYVCPKPTRKERDAGLKHLKPTKGFDAVKRKPDTVGLENPRAGAGRTTESILNHHPTVKPLKLTRWCLNLIVPKGGTVLDPFLGSGTTAAAAILEGFNVIGCEMTEEYFDLIEGRVEHAKRVRAGVVDGWC